jgi:hypothetical protein
VQEYFIESALAELQARSAELFTYILTGEKDAVQEGVVTAQTLLAEQLVEAPPSVPAQVHVQRDPASVIVEAALLGTQRLAVGATQEVVPLAEPQTPGVASKAHFPKTTLHLYGKVHP